MHQDDGSMRWYGYAALPLTVTAGLAIFCAYQAVWYSLALTAKVGETSKDLLRLPSSPLEEITE